MSGSPTQRSLALMRERGYMAEVVEKWNPHARIRQDLFGIVDVLAVGEDVVAVQTTSATNVAARIKKIENSPALPALRKCGIRIVVHGWRKGKDGRWVVREVDLSLGSREQ